MAQHDPYFQFPLVALAYGTDHTMRLRHVLNWCIVEVGRGEAASMTIAELKGVLDEMPAKDRPDDMRINDRTHLSVAKGMRTLHVRQGSVLNMTLQHDALEEFFRDMAAKGGPSPFVRVKTALVWDCINGAMPYRTLSVLVAVYCMIGRKEWPVRITRDRIQAAAMGYKSPKLMTAETLAAREDKAGPLTIDQLRYTLSQLEGDNHFVRVQLSPRRVYFSNRLAREEMEERLFKTATKRGARLTKNRSADQNLQARIRAAIKVGKPAERPPRSPREVPEKSPPIPHEVPTIIQSSLTESSLTETLFKEPGGIQAASPRVSFSSPQSATEAIASKQPTGIEADKLRKLLDQACAVGTADALRAAEGYRRQLEAMGAPA